VLLPLVRHRPGVRRLLWAACTAIPVLTAVARVGLGVHWTSDVLAGLLLGVAVTAATAAGYETWRSRSGRAVVHIGQEGVEPDLTAEA
jgi:undecaprenyl-diphosphatase